MNLCSLYKEDPELNKLYNAAKAAEATALGTTTAAIEREAESGVTTVDNSYFEEEGAAG